MISHFHALPVAQPRPPSLAVCPLPSGVVKSAAHCVLVAPAIDRVARPPRRSAAPQAAVDLPSIAGRADGEKSAALATNRQIQPERRDKASAHAPPKNSWWTARKDGGKLCRWSATPLPHPGRPPHPYPRWAQFPPGFFSCAAPNPIKQRDAPSARMMVGSLSRISRLLVRFPRNLLAAHTLGVVGQSQGPFQAP